MIKELIQPLLKSLGFKNKGLQWNRVRGEFVDVVTVQEAKHSTPERQVITLNLGVFVKPFYEAVWQKSPGGFVTEADCAVRVRLGDLVQRKPYGDALDQWWEIEAVPRGDGSAGKEIENALRDLGIPFLERFDKLDAVADHLHKVKGWQAKSPLIVIYRALAEWKTGASSTALETLSTIKGKAWEAKARLIRETINAA
ncbi:MAG: DUF4304 domain-containing protein [Kiloniellales bacterium]|nr:DUF4304 domain-containing protein [Kiloniellales bacterium]